MLRVSRLLMAVMLILGGLGLKAALQAPERPVPYFGCADGAPVWQQLGFDSVLTLPDFRFATTGGRPIARQDLGDRIVVVDFALSGCTDICPTKTRALQQVLRRTGGQDLRVVSFLLNRFVLTDRDLRHHMRESGIDSPAWMVAQAPPADMDRFCRAIPFFGPLSGKEGAATIEAHSDNVLLVDRNRYIRGVYHTASRTDMDHLVGDIGQLRRAG